MSARRLPTCKYCARPFVPDVRNHDRQQVCGRSECRLAASRAKKRRYYKRRLEHEDGFRESERIRCRDAMRVTRCRATERSLPKPEPPCPHELLSGFISQVADTTDPMEVAALMNVYADRGRRLAIPPLVRGSPV